MKKFLDFLTRRRRKDAPAETPPAEVLLIMGLDFGTAFSKVVVRHTALGFAYAVPFTGLADSSSPFLLPTSLFISGDGVFSLNENGTRLPDDIGIKYGLMTNAAAMTVDGRKIPYADACAAYLALVIRRAKESFMREYGNNLAGAPKWESINIGIPAATKSDNSRKRAFQHAANAALALADSGGEITANSVDDEIKRAKSDKERCSLIPEVAAQIQGYKNSDVRRFGLHIMADAGASTLDISSFIILDKSFNTKQGDITVFCAEVPELGVRILERRIAKCPVCKTKCPVCGNAQEVLFWDECQKAVRRVVWQTKHKKAPRERCWQRTCDKTGPGLIPDSLPFLLCGGGSAMDEYKNLPVAAREGLLTGEERFEVRQMPVPGNLLPENLSENIYHRLSVAYGLSFRLFDGNVVLPSDIPERNESDDSPEPAWKDNYVGKEQM